MSLPIRVNATNQKLSRLYTIANDPDDYYDIVIGTVRSPKVNGFFGELDDLNVEQFVKNTLAYEWFEFTPDDDWITQEQRDEYQRFCNETQVVIL